MRRIVLLATMAVLVLVSTAFVVSVAGAHNQPAAKAHKQPKAGPAAASRKAVRKSATTPSRSKPIRSMLSCSWTRHAAPFQPVRR